MEKDHPAPTSQEEVDGLRKTRQGGAKLRRRSEPPFLYIELAVLSASCREHWTREELLVYLLHCRGYNHRWRCSLMGEKAVRIRLGLTKKPWQEAQASLELRGRVRTVTDQGSKRPRVCIASAGEPYRGAVSFDEEPAAIDGHRYEDVRGESLVKVPWSLIDGSSDGSSLALADLQSVDAILLLLSIYRFAPADGVMPLREVWLAEREGGGPVVQFGSGAEEDSLGDPTCLESSAAELMDCGLLYSGVQGVGGKWVLHLAYPMAPAHMGL